MKLVYKIGVFLLFCLVMNESIAQQNKEAQRISRLKNLVNVIFVGSDSLQLYKIFTEDMSFEPNDSISDEQRFQMFKGHVKWMSEREKKHYDNGNINYLSFNKVEKEYQIKIKSIYQKNIYAIVSNNKPFMFVLFDGNRIKSFDYFLKGSDGPAYFITY